MLYGAKFLAIKISLNEDDDANDNVLFDIFFFFYNK
jgi:hypothetical protein